MNQQKIGQFIAQKRKEHYLTQIQLAKKIGVTNKTISKWENGKCMPDYSIIKSLCSTLDISVNDLLNGEDIEVNNPKNDVQMLSILKRISILEKEKMIFIGIGLVMMGILLLIISKLITGSDTRNLMSGILFGMALIQTLIGIFITTKTVAQIYF